MCSKHLGVCEAELRATPRGPQANQLVISRFYRCTMRTCSQSCRCQACPSGTCEPLWSISPPAGIACIITRSILQDSGRTCIGAQGALWMLYNTAKLSNWLGPATTQVHRDGQRRCMPCFFSRCQRQRPGLCDNGQRAAPPADAVRRRHEQAQDLPHLQPAAAGARQALQHLRQVSLPVGLRHHPEIKS